MKFIEIGFHPVECREYRMNLTSISMYFGKSPKIKYTCGFCGSQNAGRVPVYVIECGEPHLRCKNCKIMNHIPIKMKE